MKSVSILIHITFWIALFGVLAGVTLLTVAGPVCLGILVVLYEVLKERKLALQSTDAKRN